MGEPQRKPDIRELIGRAVNSSSLRMREGNETPLDRVAALGMAQLAVQSGASRRDLPVAAMRGETPDERDVLAGELSATLWHLRYGEQIDLVPKAAVLFGTWLSQRKRFSDQPAALISKFAVRALHEWLSSRCPKCAGSKKEEKTLAGNWVRPRGSMQRNAIFRSCQVCSGSGRAMPCHPERTKLLGMTRADYDKGNWGANFTAAVIWLDRLVVPLVHRPLTAELGRRKRRP